MNQVSLAYVLKSGKLEGIKGLTSVAVVEVVMNFKLWQAARAALEEAQIKGCVFHWVQPIWHRVQLLRLQEP